MIVIKIKTWKDWKKDFVNWAQAARRETCKEYVDYMESLEKDTVYKDISDVCYKYNNMRNGQIQDIIDTVEASIAKCAKEIRKLIDDCQPIKFF